MCRKKPLTESPLKAFLVGTSYDEFAQQTAAKRLLEGGRHLTVKFLRCDYIRNIVLRKLSHLYIFAVRFFSEVLDKNFL